MAAIRPYRKDKIRLEAERFDEKVVVHNYGHGGAGYTLSWGSAEIAADLAKPSLKAGDHVAVVGAGVIGLSTAFVLLERGHKVTIYSAKFTPDTTSDLAGAQFLPVMVERGKTKADKEQYQQVLLRSVVRIKELDKLKYGITLLPNYFCEGYDNTIPNLPLELFPPVETLDRLPFPGIPHAGKVLNTFRMDAPIYMKALMNEVFSQGAQVQVVEFKNFEALLSIPSKVIVNCTGMGAKKLCSDSLMVAFKGHVGIFEAQDLPYFLIHRGYMFPRAGEVVVGGSLEIGREDTAVDPAICEGILEIQRNFYTLPMAEWKEKSYPWEVGAQLAKANFSEHRH